MAESGFLPFALPDIGEREIEAVASALRSGWVTTGPMARQFETAFAEYVGPGQIAVGMNSATAGLHLALEAIGIGAGDEVLVPTWTFTASAEVVRYLGAVPVLVDVDRSTFNIDLTDAASKVTSRTKAVIPVHFAGLPVSPTALGAFAAAQDLDVVEDAAHAFPATAEGQLVGSGASRAVVFSFYATKTMTTGEGGMLVTCDEELAARVRTMRLHGIDRDAFDRYRSDIPAWRYDVVAPGYKYNLTDPAAAMGLVQLERASEMRSKRQRIAATYDAAFATTGLQLPDHGPAGTQHAWHLYVVRVPDGMDRDRFVASMSANGVGTSVHFIPLHLHSYWRDLGGYELSDFPVASAEFERVVSLPIFSSMSDAQVDRVIDTVQRVLA